MSEIWIDSDGNEHWGEEASCDPTEYDAKEEFFRKRTGSVMNILRSAYNAGKNDGEYRKKKSVQEAFEEGYAKGVEDTMRSMDEAEEDNALHIGDEVMVDEWASKYVITGFGAKHVYLLVKDGTTRAVLHEDATKTGKTYPWIAEILQELSDES